MCIFSDPGVLYRSTAHQTQLLKQRIVNIKGRIFRFKYCKTCFIFRPLGSSHCQECNNCVERFDHHCPWIGNCVGKNNFKHFFLFLTFYNILLLFNLIVGMVNFFTVLSSNDNDFQLSIKIDPNSFVEVLLCLAVFIYLIRQ